MVRVLSQNIPSDKLSAYIKSLHRATDSVAYTYASHQFAQHRYGPAPSTLYHNRYGDHVYSGHQYGTELYPWLSRATSAQQMTMVRKRVPFQLPTMQSPSTSTPSKAQLAVRREFKRACDCFGRQPQTGGEEPNGVGGYSRTWWYARGEEWSMWYYNHFMSLTLMHYLRSLYPAWCMEPYWWFNLGPIYAEYDPGNPHQTKPFSLALHLYILGYCEGTCWRPGCVRKKEGTQAWVWVGGKLEQQIVCSYYEIVPGFAGKGNYNAIIDPRWVWNVSNGLYGPGWPGTVQVYDGYGIEDGLVYREKDLASLAGKKYTVMVDTETSWPWGNVPLFLNSTIVPTTIVYSENREGGAYPWGSAWLAWDKALENWNNATWNEVPIDVYFNSFTHEYPPNQWGGSINAGRVLLEIDLRNYSPNDYESAHLVVKPYEPQGYNYYSEQGWVQDEYNFIEDVTSSLGLKWTTSYFISPSYTPIYPGQQNKIGYALNSYVLLMPK